MDTKLTTLLSIISKNIAYLAFKQGLVHFAINSIFYRSCRALCSQRIGAIGCNKNLFFYCLLFVTFSAIATENISAQCSTSAVTIDEDDFLLRYIYANESAPNTTPIFTENNYDWELTEGHLDIEKLSSSQFSEMNLHGISSPVVNIPQITVDKDDDDNTDDFQIVPEGGTALFFINITNSGIENLCNLVISDPKWSGM